MPFDSGPEMKGQNRRRRWEIQKQNILRKMKIKMEGRRPRRLMKEEAVEAHASIGRQEKQR
jgi:hypothetical protein